jgi:hypothetical protein
MQLMNKHPVLVIFITVVMEIGRNCQDTTYEGKVIETLNSLSLRLNVANHHPTVAR